MGHTNQILCIKNISIETLGNMKNYLLSDGFKVKEILATTKTIKSQNLPDYDAVFILGGPMSVNDNLDYLLEEKKLINSSFNLGVPIFGICLGSQLIASSCGGKVYRGPKKEIGWGEVRITSKGQSSIFDKIIGSKIRVFHWHGDTFSLPSEADVLSESDLYIQAFRFKNAFGIQFHLEVTKNMIENWIRKYDKELKNEKISRDGFLNDIDRKVSELERNSKIVYENFKSTIA
ncbi:MAG TPA: type 1 glutamine amidotransferase [Candidatus Nitrosocosmicus sp.]|nr:type 1 glutamine amidotransferase [Candidatus Nitrosocosmicus sp.]